MADGKKGRQIKWYRTPIDRELLRELSRRSNAKAAVQTFLFLGICLLTFTGAFYAARHWSLPAVVGMIFLHGMVASFMINAVHELGHNTVFASTWLNRFFTHLFAFPGWINHEAFGTSHSRHHAYTLHPPDDLEVVLPVRHTLKQFFRHGFVAYRSVYDTLRSTYRTSRGRFAGQWELALFPEAAPEKRRPVVRWARILLIGHGLILVASIALQCRWPGQGFWVLPILLSGGVFYGGWLQFLCNNTQHSGLQDNVPDFRLCCRTILLNKALRVLYWDMNYHTEHHAFPTVPCYNLAKLHRAIEHDLPPSPRGLIAAWREIGMIMRKQQQDPTYQHVQAVPAHATQTSFAS